MADMQTANVMLALGGDTRNTVPKNGVTASEIAVLQFIHGTAAVHDIQPTGSVVRTDRQEIGRLREAYGRRDGETFISPAVDALFPGAAARAFHSLNELELDEELFKPTERETPKKAEAKPKPETKVDDPKDDLDEMTLKELQAVADKEQVDLTGVTKKADVLEAIKTARAAKQDDVGETDVDDQSGDMNDSLFN